ncbi:MAG: hypothetical protein V2I67_08375 [Thermoanaerobaculales bacterium]|jgi:hypothetical protein|nr:hypothetical protein [Thermoanaerobaculales bacterium]
MRSLVVAAVLIALAACAVQEGGQNQELDVIAEGYVGVVLEMGEYLEHYVDFYFGPEELRPEPANEDADPPFDELLFRANGLREALAAVDLQRLDPEQVQRHRFLDAHLLAVETKLEMESGASFAFDDEFQRLFGARPPSYDTTFIAAKLKQLDALLAGDGDLGDRYYDYVWRFVIPEERLAVVFQTAIDEAKLRTSPHTDLYDGDLCLLELVTDKPWDAFNSYEGRGNSVVQVNTGYRKQIKSARDAACHECYPGHHVHSSMWEKELYEDRGWVEFSVGATSTPSYLIYEGIAEYAVEAAFPGEEWIEFQRATLFEAAGLDPAEAERYVRAINLYKMIQWSSIIEGSRLYLDGDLDREQAIDFFMTYTLRTRPEAEGMLSAIELYRSYLVNYLFGAQMIRNYINANGGNEDNPGRRWELVREIMSSPVLPSDLLEVGDGNVF